jgi:hypothetical protein
MSWIQTIRDFSKDTFATLPLLLIGFTFLFGFLTTNTGLIWFFIGQILFVPAITLLVNENIISLFSTRPGMTISALLMTFIPNLSVILSLIAKARRAVDEEISVPDSTVGGYIFPLFNNILILVSSFLASNQGNSSQDKTCSLLPAKEGDSVWAMPSSWIAEITFFCSYVLANALSLFNEPVPDLVPIKGLSEEEGLKANAAQKRKLDDKVFNRKVRSGWIIFTSLLALFIFMLMRYKMMNCEGSFVKSILPLLSIITGAFTWFNFVYTSCGVRPVDILGIMTQVVDQTMAQNPIVCTGEKQT